MFYIVSIYSEAIIFNQERFKERKINYTVTLKVHNFGVYKNTNPILLNQQLCYKTYREDYRDTILRQRLCNPVLLQNSNFIMLPPEMPYFGHSLIQNSMHPLWRRQCKLTKTSQTVSKLYTLIFSGGQKGRYL